MATYSKAQIQTKIDTEIADNTSNLVTPAKLRATLAYLKDQLNLASEVSHTNAAKPTYTLLSQFIDFLMGNNIPIWNNTDPFLEHYVVSHNGILYKAKQNIEDGEDEPQVNSHWMPILPLYSVPEWNINNDYITGYVVLQSGRLYVANEDVTTGDDPPEDLIKWSQLTIKDDGDLLQFDTIADLVSKNDMTEVVISDLNIDWSLGKYFTKTIGSASTFTFSNVVVGKTIIIEVTGGYDITWPAGKLVNGTRDSALTYYHVTCLKTGKYLIETKTYA
jgi:hypothetical protein